MKYFALLLCLIALVSIGNAQSWQYVNNGMTAQYTYDIAFNGYYVFVGTINGVYRSASHGGIWEKTPGNEFCHNIEVIDGVLYAMHTDGMKKSTNNGTSWSPVFNQQVRAVAKINNILFVAGSFGVAKSVNDGATWTSSNGSIYPDGSDGRLSNTYGHSLVIQGSDMYLGTFGGNNGGIFCSRDYGAHWQLWENNGKKYVWDMLATGTAIFASVSNDLGPMGILKCTNRVNWWSANVGIVNPYIQSFGAYGSTLYAGNMSNTPQGAVGGPYRSTDNGNSWTLFNQGLLSAEISGINSDGLYVYVANWDKGVARYPVVPMSTVGSLKLTSYAVDPWGLLGANSRVKLYNSSWTLVDERWVDANSVVTFMDLLPGLYSVEVYNTRSNPWGEVYCGWKGSFQITAGVQTVDVFKHNTPVMPAARVYKGSTNEELNSPYQMISAGSLVRVEVDVMNPAYLGSAPLNAYSTIYLDRNMEGPFDLTQSSPTQNFPIGSTKTTTSWVTVRENGTYNLSCATYSIFSGGPLLTDAGGWIGPVFSVSGGTDVEPTTPDKFAVFQNYPNPFNPTTTIEYSVEQSAQIRLTVVDVLGRETVLVDEFQTKGGYRNTWTSSGSGLYFAVLETNGQKRTIRMLAIK